MTVVYGLIILCLIVCLHELGHFFAAIACGVKVESFSVGMGPVLLHKTIKNVDWRLSLFPIGGYCAMKGEKDFQNACEAGLKHIEADEGSMYSVHPFKRALIGFAGPFANLFFAFLAYTIIAMTGYTYYSSNNRITLANEVYPELHSAAADAGLLTGDRISKINGTEITEFSQIYEIVSTHPAEDLQIEVKRQLSETAPSSNRVTETNIAEAGKPAGPADSSASNERFEFLTFTVHTDMDTSTGQGKIGVVSDASTYEAHEAKRYSFFPAIAKGITDTGNGIALTIRGIGILFKGVDVTQAVSGPARITTMLGSTAKYGFKESFRTGIVSVLQFMAIISISLFFMNLLPIPILDGSLVLFSLIEGIFSIEISPNLKNKVQYIGLVFIAALFLLALAGDARYILRLFHAR